VLRSLQTKKHQASQLFRPYGGSKSSKKEPTEFQKEERELVAAESDDDKLSK